MSATDVLNKLGRSEVNELNPLQRILTITDGTVTEILEAAFLERIQLIKVYQQVVPATRSHGQLEPDEGEVVMERHILLRGSESGRNYAYAESLIAVNRLGSSFCEELLNSHTPLGRLWREHRLETFKELLEVNLRAAGNLSHYFGGESASSLMSRTYRVFSGGRVVMLISEYFPKTYDQPMSYFSENVASELLMRDESRG